MSQAETESKNIAFEGRIQLNGDAAPALDVIVELTEAFIVLGHPSGELGRWDRSSVAVAPIGRGWFTINVEDETVTFLPRRPGHFAASTVDLVPGEAIKKRWWQRSKTKQEDPDETPALSRKELKRLEQQEAARPPSAPTDAATTYSAPPAAEPAPPARQVPEQTAPAQTPIERPAAPVAPEPAPASEVYAPGTPTQPPTEPASPWDDVPVPEIPGAQAKREEEPSQCS